MAKHKKLEPLSAAELAELLDENPSKKGLERILRFDLGPERLPSPAAAPSQAPDQHETLPAAPPPGESLRSEPHTGKPERGGSHLIDSPRGEALPGEPVPGLESLRSPSLSGDSLPKEPPPLRNQPGGSHPGAAPPSVSLGSDPPFTPTVNVAGVGKRRYHRCTRVQDAHTPGEDKLLAAMVRLAKHKGGLQPDGSWTLAASMDELAEAAGMHRTNIRNNLKGLIDKLAIEVARECDVHLQTPRLYRGFPFRRIMERRRAAGMEWVVKNRGVSFVPTSEAEEALRSEALRSASWDDESW